VKRSGPLTRKTPLRRGTWIKRPAGLARRSAKKAADSRVWSYVTVLAFHIARGQCLARRPGCTYAAQHGHHRVLQSQGGPDALWNCLPTCPSCHRWLHANPAESVARGTIVPGAVYRRRVSLPVVEEVAGG
jgi:hypothetical protein